MARRLRACELLRAAASRDQDLSAAASLHPDEDVPSDDYEAWLLSSVIANPGGIEHLEWMRFQAHKHGRFLIGSVSAALHYRIDLFPLRFFFDCHFRNSRVWGLLQAGFFSRAFELGFPGRLSMLVPRARSWTYLIFVCSTGGTVLTLSC